MKTEDNTEGLERREFMKFFGMMAALSGSASAGALEVKDYIDEQAEYVRPGQIESAEPIESEGFADKHRVYGSLPRHAQHKRGQVPNKEMDVVETTDGVEATAEVAQVWDDGVPHSVPVRGSREQSWRKDFEAEEVYSEEWTRIAEINYGFVTYPPNKVPILSLYTILDTSRPANEIVDKAELRVLQIGSQEEVFHVSASNALEDVRYQEYPLNEIDYGTSALQPENARFKIQARADGGKVRVRPSVLGLDMEVL